LQAVLDWAGDDTAKWTLIWTAFAGTVAMLGGAVAGIAKAAGFFIKLRHEWKIKEWEKAER
jgi:hypothetical protein